MNAKLYHYKALVVKVYDGDTITVNINLGFGIIMRKVKIRLLGIDTPELRRVSDEEKVRGIEAREFLSDLVLDRIIVLKTKKDKTGKYGRLLGTIYINDIDINQMMIDQGHAVKYLG